MAAGLVGESLGHDRIAEFAGAGRAMPLTFFALGLGGLSLMGLPPSGGFAAKWLLLRASVASGQWLWAVVILAGGLLAAGYVYRILAPALADGAVALEGAAATEPGGDRAGAGDRGGGARFRAAIVLRLSSRSAGRPRRRRCNDRSCSAAWLLAATLDRPAPLSWRRASRAACGRQALALQWLAPVPALIAGVARDRAAARSPSTLPALRMSLATRPAGRAPARGRCASVDRRRRRDVFRRRTRPLANASRFRGS